MFFVWFEMFLGLIFSCSSVARVVEALSFVNLLF